MGLKIIVDFMTRKRVLSTVSSYRVVAYFRCEELFKTCLLPRLRQPEKTGTICHSNLHHTTCHRWLDDTTHNMLGNTEEDMN